MTKWIMLVCIVLCNQIIFAQKTLHVEGTTPNLYIIHTVSNKETLYGISRMYNITPNELANYNKINIDTKLMVGQQLNIPLNKTNFLQDGTKTEELVPIYYTVNEHEGLYRISVNHNKVDIGLIKTWNQLTSDGINTGADLIIGYLRVKQDQSPLAPNTNVKIEPAINNSTNTPINTTNDNKQSSNTSNIDIASMGGFFEEAFKEETKYSTNLQNITGEAAAFKSTSGWQDRRYYALMNNVQPGTFIKVSNTINGSYIYAKVLGNLPEMKENEGLLIRISNAAAAILSLNDGTKANVQVTKPY